jgi:hypothetical protein
VIEKRDIAGVESVATPTHPHLLPDAEDLVKTGEIIAMNADHRAGRGAETRQVTAQTNREDEAERGSANNGRTARSMIRVHPKGVGAVLDLGPQSAGRMTINCPSSPLNDPTALSLHNRMPSLAMTLH